MPFSDYAAVVTGLCRLAGGGLGGFITYKTQTRTVTTQTELAELSRAQVITDRRDDAVVAMIEVLLRAPLGTPEITSDSKVVKRYETQMKAWLSDFKKTLAPLHAYSNDQFLNRLLTRLSTLQQA